MQKQVTIIGRHARPFCENAHAHGWRVTAVDGFNDLDMERFAAPLTPGGMAETAARFVSAWRDAPEPLLFCAPIEAAPEELAHAQRTKRTLNAPAGAVAMVRELAFLKRMCGDGIDMPDTLEEAGPPQYGWIIKNRFTAGGAGIRQEDGTLRDGEYRQEALRGDSIGAIFYSIGQKTLFCGATLHINYGFRYGGGIFPAMVPPHAARALEQFGERAARASGLIGWWGADFIFNKEGLWLLEINPRPTAGMELMARVRGVDLVSAQMAALTATDFDHLPKGGTGCVGNRVLYAEEAFTFNGAKALFARGARDVPRDGTRVGTHAPVLTLYAETATLLQCRMALDRMAKEGI